MQKLIRTLVINRPQMTQQSETITDGCKASSLLRCQGTSCMNAESRPDQYSARAANCGTRKMAQIIRLGTREAPHLQQGFHKFELAASLDLSSSATALMNSSVLR
jgi:hypothetical protein